MRHIENRSANTRLLTEKRHVPEPLRGVRRIRNGNVLIVRLSMQPIVMKSWPGTLRIAQHIEKRLVLGVLSTA
jgi:hypothetical protein